MATDCVERKNKHSSLIVRPLILKKWPSYPLSDSGKLKVEITEMDVTGFEPVTSTMST